MGLELSSFDSVFLTSAIVRRPAQWHLFGSFFAPQSPVNTDVFELHDMMKGQSAIPTVSPYGAGVLRQPDAWTKSVVKAPRFRTKRTFTAAKVLTDQQFGRNPYDVGGDALAAAVSMDLDDHRHDHDYMIEIMCAQATVTGKMTLYNVDESGTLTGTYTVDFGRPASHDIAVSDKWTADSTDLFGSMDAASMLIQDDADGRGGTDLIMGAKAWAAFHKHPDVVDVLDNRRIDVGALNPKIATLYNGDWYGLRIWVAQGSYVDVDGTKKPYIASEDAVLVDNSAESVIEYGRPLDFDCAGPTQYFVKQFKQDDPSGLFTVAESRPLPVTRHAGWAVHFIGCVA